ncbi:MAG: aminopeptidase [Candidatus Saliniplasma sp.]
MSGEKSTLEDELSFSIPNGWEQSDKNTISDIMDFAEDYKKFMTNSKTERETIDNTVSLLEENGFVSIAECDELNPGDKVYIINKKKAIAIIVIGQNKITDGCQILASHIDAPRLDLKARPIYEDKDASLGLFNTHYYGGIKKYQWVSTPLAIHGKVVKEDGQVIDVTIGEDTDDPVFAVSDLLPHLSKKKQSDRKMKDVIKGEELNVIIGGKPIDDDDVEEKVKTNILKILDDKYGITEEDFTSAEIEIVPAGPARDLGLDRSMLGAYGQDDRVCAYTSLKACLDIEDPSKTSLVFMFDKEEIGSEGNTGANSRFTESVFQQILAKTLGDYSLEDFRVILENSKGISGDVNPGVNPSFKGVHDLNNAGKMSKGIVVTKYTGAGGKFSASDAHAEYAAYIRGILNENDVSWQTAELGKVDEGGGGTVAKFLASLNLDIIDAGPPLLGMHSPFEIISKVDVYNTFKAYRSFLEAE